jgi:hypothetical protein
MTQSRIRGGQWWNGPVTLSDPELAQLAQDAADSVELGLAVHIAPAANDDPYRWGSHGWTVTVEGRRRARIWIPADASPGWIFDEIAALFRAETAQ